MTTFFGSDGWGPVSQDRTVIDFTVGFQDIIFLFLPSVLFSLFVTLQFAIAGRQTPNGSQYELTKAEISKFKWLIALKTIVNVSFLAMSIATTVLSQGPPSTKFSLAFISLGALMLTLHGFFFTQRSWRPLRSAETYLLALSLALAMRVRTEFTLVGMNAGNNTFAILTSVMLGLATLSFILEGVPRLTKKSAAANGIGPEDRSSLLSYLTFSWLQSQMSTGYSRYRKNEPMEEEDVIHVSQFFDPVSNFKDFDTRWQKELQKDNPSLLNTLARTNGLQCLVALVLSMAASTIQFAQPQLLNGLINVVESYSTPMAQNDNVSSGYEIALGLLAASVLYSLFMAYSTYALNSVGANIRTSLMQAAFRKALSLSPDGKKNRTNGAMSNIVAVDAERFYHGMQSLPQLITIPYEIALALYFIYQQLSNAVFAGLAVVLLAMPIPILISAYWSRSQGAKMAAMDNRNKLVNQVLLGIKTVKLYNWQESFLSRLFDLRETELKSLRKVSLMFTIIFPFVITLPNLITLVSFAVYAAMAPEDKPLDAARIFTSISLFSLLQAPMNNLMNTLANFVEIRVAYQRVQDFLKAEELPEAQTQFKPTDEKTAQALELTEKLDQNIAVSIKDAAFAWSINGESTLKDVNLQVTKGSLVAIIGRVGTGKTSLLSAMIEECYRPKGSVLVSGSMAYCAQTPWIQNATIKENILFGEEYDEAKLRSIIKACDLAPDLEILPNGIETKIGERGVNISGGQQARVALARAAYSDADILLLDDPLSAVDAHVDRYLFEELIGPSGLLKDKTRVLVTHAIHHLHQVDHIVVLSDGKIAQQGTYPELMGEEGIFRTLTETWAKSKLDESDAKKPEKAKETEDSANDDIVEDDDEEFVANGNVDAGIYIQYFKALTVPIAVVSFLLFILAQAAQTGSVSWLEHYSSELAKGNNPSILKYLIIYGLLTILSAAFIGLAVYVFMAIAALRASSTLFRMLSTRVLRLPMAWFDVTPVGRITNRFSKDIYSLDEMLPRLAVNLVPIGTAILGTVAVIAVSTPIFLAALVPLASMYYLIQVYYTATSRAIKRLDSGRTRSPIYAFFLESLTGASSVRAYKHTERFDKEFATRLGHNMRPFMAWTACNSWLSWRIETIGAFVTFLSAVFVIVDRHHIAPSLAGLSVSYSLQITQFLTYFVQIAVNIENEIVSIERINEYCQLETEAPETTADDPPPEWPKCGKIQFDRLSARYRDHLPLALNDLSLEIEAGQRIGIIGRTGSGKSTITMALFRIIEADHSTSNLRIAGSNQGKIIIDGVDISTIGLSALRKQLSIIPQQSILFSGTIRSNIDPEDKHTDQELWDALDAADLAEHIRKMEGGLDASIEQGGSNLSAGQGQLMSLCRVLLRKSKILILDEATSSVDLETDAIIQKTIRKHFKDTTIITIAHRIKTIMDYDQILVMADGELAEFAPPQVLLEDKKGLFYSLAKEAGELDETPSRDQADEP